jgi:hypothetical protein
MKQLTILLLLISSVSYSQSLKDKLRGNWLCTKILDSNGNPTPGKFTNSDEYLEFGFFKNYLSISEAPFDNGSQLPIEYGNDYINLFPESTYKLQEKKYTVGLINNDSLILITTNTDDKPIYYHFVNQAKLLQGISPFATTIDEGFIIITHLRSGDSKGANRNADYQISNEPVNPYPGPTFDDYAFGLYFSNSFTFPDTYQPDTVSNELIIDFDVTGKGAQNIRIIQGLDEEINESVIKIIAKTGKKWKPLIIDEHPVNTTLRFHFVFFLGRNELHFKKD